MIKAHIASGFTTGHAIMLQFNLELQISRQSILYIMKSFAPYKEKHCLCHDPSMYPSLPRDFFSQSTNLLGQEAENSLRIIFLKISS